GIDLVPFEQSRTMRSYIRGGERLGFSERLLKGHIPLQAVWRLQMGWVRKDSRIRRRRSRDRRELRRREGKAHREAARITEIQRIRDSRPQEPESARLLARVEEQTTSSSGH